MDKRKEAIEMKVEQVIKFKTREREDLMQQELNKMIMQQK